MANNKILEIPDKNINYSPQFRNLIPGEGVEFKTKNERVASVNVDLSTIKVSSPVLFAQSGYISAVCDTKGATTLYMFNGGVFVYTQPVDIKEGRVGPWLFISKKNDMIDSDMVAFLLPPSLSFSDNKVNIQSNNNNFGSIIYTLDGSTPSETNGYKYASSFEVPDGVDQVRAIEIWNGNNSDVSSIERIKLSSHTKYDYEHNTATFRVLADPNEVKIYYSDKGDDPDEKSDSGSKYTLDSIYGNDSVQIKFRAYSPGYIPSDILTINYGPSTLAPPVISEVDGAVVISADIPTEAQYFSIIYTDDSTDPTALNGDPYTEPLTLPSGTKVMAILYYTVGNIVSEIAQFITE